MPGNSQFSDSESDSESIGWYSQQTTYPKGGLNMEKKTIGGFIAALRKVNGMTQKDLAERLNVSDKTVSSFI